MNTNTNLSNMMPTFQGDFPIFPKPILSQWAEAAHTKGFSVTGRICDRLHLALQCHRCGATNKTRIFTLLSTQPHCHACIEAGWRADAASAGLQFLRRDTGDRHHAIYRAPCGHDLWRQFELVKRVAAGKTGIRCEICHTSVEAAESAARRWTLLGADTDGDPNYRQYRHDACGHEQRIARANMQSGRFACGGCSEAWPAAPSYIYLMRFVLASSREVIKLGFSRDPMSRLEHQLRRDPEMPCEIIRKVPMPTGHAAIRTEKAMHRTLAHQHPEAIVDPTSWQGQIRVKTEIYDDSLTPVVQQMLDDLAERERDS